MLKKLILTLTSLLLLLSLVGCTQKKEILVSNVENTSEVDMSYYRKLKDNTNFKSISKETLIDCIGNNNTNAIIYMGYSDCENCQKVIADIQKAAIERNQNIYYLDTEQEIKTDTDYDLLFETLKPVLVSMDENKPDDLKIYTPHIFFIINGELVQGYVGYASGYDYSKLFKKNGF